MSDDRDPDDPFPPYEESHPLRVEPKPDPFIATLAPLPVESHPYRPTIDLSVAVLCVERPNGVPCNTIYAKESQGEKAEETCPKCGSTAAFALRRVIDR